MAVIRKLTAGGDTVLKEWSAETLDPTSAEGKAAVAEVQKILDDAKRRGDGVFRVAPPEPAVRVTTIDPQVEAEYGIVPRLVGG